MIEALRVVAMLGKLAEAFKLDELELFSFAKGEIPELDPVGPDLASKYRAARARALDADEL